MIPVLPSLYQKSVGACNISDPTGSDLIFSVNGLYILYCLYYTLCSYENYFIFYFVFLYFYFLFCKITNKSTVTINL